MEQSFGVTLNQGYVNRVTSILNSGMIPQGNSDIQHRLILGKKRAGEEIRKWKKQKWNGYCKQSSKDK